MELTPKILDKVFSEEEYSVLHNHLFNLNKTYERHSDDFEVYLSHDKKTGRYLYTDEIIKEYGQKLVPLARNFFNSKTLLMSYSLFSHYEGSMAKLPKHKDNNACTYTIDFCLYQTEPWDLYIEGNPYTLYPNQAVALWGEDQEHWREEYPNPDNQKVGMVFFHFTEPDHWFFVENPNKLEEGVKRWPKWQAFTQRD